MKINSIVFFVLVAGTAYGAFNYNDADFHFIDTECSVSAAEPTGIAVRRGTNSHMACYRSAGEKARCITIGLDPGVTFGGQQVATEIYDRALDFEGLIVLRSQSGNIFFLGLESSASASNASSHLIAEKGIVMTKICNGKYFTKETWKTALKDIGRK